jgi:hypothetical protein
MEIVVHEIATDGLPDMDQLTGRVAFIFDGCVVSGWPLRRDDPDVAHVYAREGYDGDDTLWEGNSDVSHNRPMAGVTHWLEFPVPAWEIERGIVQ